MVPEPNVMAEVSALRAPGGLVNEAFREDINSTTTGQSGSLELTVANDAEGWV